MTGFPVIRQRRVAVKNESSDFFMVK